MFWTYPNLVHRWCTAAHRVRPVWCRIQCVPATLICPHYPATRPIHRREWLYSHPRRISATANQATGHGLDSWLGYHICQLIKWCMSHAIHYYQEPWFSVRYVRCARPAVQSAHWALSDSRPWTMFLCHGWQPPARVRWHEHRICHLWRPLQMTRRMSLANRRSVHHRTKLLIYSGRVCWAWTQWCFAHQIAQLFAPAGSGRLARRHKLLIQLCRRRVCLLEIIK